MMRGFTLLELLIVLTIAGLLASVVAPRSFTLYDKFAVRMQRHAVQKLKQRAVWEAFIRDTHCRLQQIETKEKTVIQLICGDNGTIVQLEMPPGSLKKTGRRTTFACNAKGIPIPSADAAADEPPGHEQQNQ